MIELVKKRQENSKTFSIGDRKQQLAVSIGAIHYKDNYANKSESWKDIDLTWKGNRITKAPYELTRDGNKLTIRDKRSGEVSTIELLGEVGLDTDLEVVPEYSRVRFTRILKSDKAPVEAEFRVTGNFIVRASDEEGELPVESGLKDGILTETLKPDRAIKYPVRIDPTWQVGTSTDDCIRRDPPTGFFHLATIYLEAGWGSSARVGCGMRFTNITIPQGTTINSAKLTLQGYGAETYTVCNTRISAEDVDDAATFSTDSDFDTRYAARTTARVDWDGIEVWAVDVDYDSPEIKTVIKEIVDRGGWVSGQDMVIFWEDYDSRSTVRWAQRRPYSEDGTGEAPKLVITYVGQPTGWAGGDVLGVAIGTISKINGVALADITKVNGVS